MAVSFASYEIARSGLFVNERGLYVTGHNISNVNTPGYVRQQAMIATGPYQNEYSSYGLYQLGLGADIQQIRQIRHVFLDNIYRQESTNLGYWEARNKTFNDVQAILGEPMGAGLQNVMNQFWDSWQELSKEPDSLTVRALVRQRGEALVHHINHVGTQLDKLQSDLNSEIRVRIDEVNRITEQIAGLNNAILKTEVSGDTANDYRDQRNSLVDRLSKLVNAEVMEMQDSQINVTVGGYFLVAKGVQTKLYAGEGAPGTLFDVPKIEGTDIEVKLRSGIIKGLMESRGEISGAIGSIGNGNPNTKADIVFVVDVSDTNAANLSNIADNIADYAGGLKKAGIDYNLRLITYGSSASSCADFGTDLAGLSAAILSAAALADTGNNFGGPGGVINALEDVADFRQDALRFALVFTAESIDGDNGTEVDDPTAYVSRLNSLEIETSLITGSSYFNEGESSAEAGWNAVAGGTGGRLYDIDSTDYGALAASMAKDAKTDVNYNISVIEHTNNIISDLRRRLNALLNIMAREVNSIHREGKTLGTTPLDGDDFFTAVNPAYPLQMGNIRLNPKFAESNGLNYIAASLSGASGDNTIALKIANLRNEQFIAEITGILSLDDYYQSIILHVGNNGSDAARISENQYALVQSADSSRQSITGVSMDEEMGNMMKYKFAYNASSRAMNVIDEMIETVITKMGLAGR